MGPKERTIQLKIVFYVFGKYEIGLELLLSSSIEVSITEISPSCPHDKVLPEERGNRQQEPQRQP